MKHYLKNLIIAIISVLFLVSFANAQDIAKKQKDEPKKLQIFIKPSPATDDAEPFIYEVPLVETEKYINKTVSLTAAIEELTAEAILQPHKDGSTRTTIKINNLDKVKKDKTYTLWLTTLKGSYKRIRDFKFSKDVPEIEIKGRIPTNKFGFFITVEDTRVIVPTSEEYAVLKQY